MSDEKRIECDYCDKPFSIDEVKAYEYFGFVCEECEEILRTNGDLVDYNCTCDYCGGKFYSEYSTDNVCEDCNYSIDLTVKRFDETLKEEQE